MLDISFFQETRDSDAVWCPIGDGEVEVLVRPWMNPACRRAMQPVLRKYGRIIRRGNVSPHKLVEIYSDVVLDTVLEDWRGLGQNGKEIKYSKDKAQKLFRDYPPLLDEIIECASEQGNFRQAEVEEAAEKMGNG